MGTAAGLPAFLAEERQVRADQEQADAAEQAAMLSTLEGDPRVAEVRRLIAEIAGSDAVLMLKGHQIV